MIIIPANTISGGYEVANSLRFNDGSSDYLNRTLGTPTNNKKWTLSFWFKKTVNGANPYLFTAYNSSTNDNRSWVNFQTDDTMSIAHYDVSAYTWRLVTNRLFRDVSAWYHILVAVDTTQGTASNRLKLYINGVQETSFSTETYPAQNYNPQFNSAQPFNIGRSHNDSAYVDGYMAEVVFIDGQALDHTSFGEFDEDTGIWKPINVSGLTFGTNGFYLPFENSGALGQDDSGNGNNFTVNNLTSIDQATDTCTNNFATWNPLVTYASQPSVHSEGNLQVITTNADPGYWGSSSSIGVSQGKWYCEIKIISNSDAEVVGVTTDPQAMAIQGNNFSNIISSGNFVGYTGTDGDGVANGNFSYDTSYGDSYAQNDIIGIALDMDNLKIYFSKNGTWQNSGDPTSGSTGTGSLINLQSGQTYFICCIDAGGSLETYSANFGSPPYSISSGNSDGNGYGNFEYAVPSGYYALNTKNLAEYG